MSGSDIPTEWSEENSDSWSHSRLPIRLKIIGIGEEWEVSVTPLPEDMPWHSIDLNIRRDDKQREREVAVSYMEEFSDIEMDIRNDYPDLSEERKILIAATEAVLNLR